MAVTSSTSVTFADLLRYHRAAAGLTQEELAARAHLSVDAISTLERGIRRSPRKDTIALLAEALNLTPEDRATLVASAHRAPAATPPGPLNGKASNIPPDTLPDGIVTFLFADLDGSARLQQQLGDEYAGVLSTLHEALRIACVAHHGHELGAQGDHFFFVFADPDDAIAAAVAAQRALGAHTRPTAPRVWLRMGIHTGLAPMIAGRYVGVEVHRALRVAVAGHGGQVLVSQATVAEIAKRGQEFPSGVSLKSLGAHRLGDLRQREAVSQLMLPDIPGLPSQFPPLKTSDRWPIARVNLIVILALTLALLAIGDLFLPLIVPAFPRTLGWIASAGAIVLFAVVILTRPQGQRVLIDWRAARQPFITITSVLLTAVVLLTTILASRPAQLATPHPPRLYDFSYTYHRPTHLGGSITIGTGEQMQTLAPDWIGTGQDWFGNLFLWQTCLVQLPDQTLGLQGWKADQCTEVPTVDNGGESPDAKTTTFHIDPRAVWSDGVPITADDFLFGQRLSADPNLNTADFFRSMTLTKLDAHTVRIVWDKPHPDYLSSLGSLYPAPLHIYGRGKFAGIFNPATGAYNSALAQQLNMAPEFNTTIPVNNGPFTVQSFVPDHQVVLVKNPRFFSRFFHTPALDKITVITVAQDFLPEFAAGLNPTTQQGADTLRRYRQGALDLAVILGTPNLRQLGDIPSSQVQIASSSNTIEVGFNQRAEAPNAHSNGGVSIFTDRRVRQAFIEAFDRCAAVRALVGDVTCGDPNLFTDESDATAAVAAYDPTFKLPAYNPTDAARLMDAAGYRVIDGIRRDKDGVTPLALKLVVSPGASGSISIAQQMQLDFARNLRVGVTVVNDEIAFWNRSSPIQTGAFDLIMVASQNSIDPIGRLTNDMGTFDQYSIYHCCNPFGIIDPQAIQLDQLAAQTPSDEQRAVILLDLNRSVSQQYYVEPMYITAIIALKKPTLCNFKLWPDAWSYLWNIADWYTAPSCP